MANETEAPTKPTVAEIANDRAQVLVGYLEEKGWLRDEPVATLVALDGLMRQIQQRLLRRARHPGGQPGGQL